MNLLHTIFPDADYSAVEKDSEHSIRIQRIVRQIKQFGPNGLKAIDNWLDQQEAGQAGYVLILCSGEETETHVTQPEAGFAKESELDESCRKSLGLDHKRLRRRKS